MLNRFALLGAVCIAIPVGAAPLAQADPPPPPDPAAPVNATNPLPPEGAVPSAPPGVLDTPDGWHLEVVGANETQLPVAPLTTAITSREYLVAGTFTGKITGGGKTKLAGGSIEAGEQIGCGIISDEEEINPGFTFSPGINIPFTNATTGGTGPFLRARCIEAWHGHDRRHRQEVVQGHDDPHHDHGRPDQDRPVRRPVVHPLVRNPDELDRQHRRRHHLPRRHQGRLTPVVLERKKTMLNRFAALAVCSLVPLGTAPLALADPPADDAGPPPDNGMVAS
jgi:hypothetical protein